MNDDDFFDLEAELYAAMTQETDGLGAPELDMDRIRAVGRRRRTMLISSAAAVAAVGMGTALAVGIGGGGGNRAGTAVAAGPTQTPSTTAAANNLSDGTSTAAPGTSRKCLSYPIPEKLLSSPWTSRPSTSGRFLSPHTPSPSHGQVAAAPSTTLRMQSADEPADCSSISLLPPAPLSSSPSSKAARPPAPTLLDPKVYGMPNSTSTK